MFRGSYQPHWKKSDIVLGWLWAMYANCAIVLLDQQVVDDSPDPVHTGPHAHNWPAEDGNILRPTAEIERDGRICRGHHPDPSTMATDRIPN